MGDSHLADPFGAFINDLRQILDLAVVELYLVTDETMSLVAVTSNERVEPFIKHWAAFAPGHGLVGRVAASGQSEHLPDIDKAPSFIRREAAATAGLRSAYAAPLLGADDHVLGVLVLLHTTPRMPAEVVDDTALHDALGVVGMLVQRDGLTHSSIASQELKLRGLGRTLSAGLAVINSGLAHGVTARIRGIRALVDLTRTAIEDTGTEPSCDRDEWEDAGEDVEPVGWLLTSSWSLRHLDDLTRRLTTLASILSHRPVYRMVTLRPFVMSLARRTGAVLNDGSLDGLPDAIEFDPLLLETALEEVLSNAVIHADPESPVDIGVRHRRGRVLLHLRTTGPPLTEEQLASAAGVEVISVER
ncbi:GAF domain-containing protein, partial [Euzebya pacifica]|uniref:GAF domain-containing protein n=1 Tax=Euzebya pacifica TaxID=1608957 RepID=UPI0030F60FFE